MKWLGIIHRHRWHVVSATCDGKEHWYPPRADYIRQTDVVLRCTDCGKLKEQTLRGQHTIEALQGESSEVLRMIETLK
jgi:hypothetical protein